MRKLRLDLNKKVKLGVLVALAVLVGGLGYAYNAHTATAGTNDSRVAGKTNTSKAAGVSDSDKAAGSRANLMTPPPAPAADTAAWPDTPAAPAALAANSLAAVASGSSLASGAKLTVALYENSGPVAINSVQTRLTYDASQLEFSDIGGSADFGLEAATDTKTTGVIQLARAVGGGEVSGQRLVAVLHFTLKAGAAGPSSIAPDLAQTYLVRASDATNVVQSVVAAQITAKAN